MKEEGRNRTKKQSCQPLADCPARQGGRSARAARTVRQGIADCPHPCRRPSGLSPGLSEKDTRTTRDAPRITDPLRGARGLSVRHPRAVRPAHADRPKLRPTKTQNHDGSKRKATKNMKNTRRTRAARTVRQDDADCPRGTDRAEKRDHHRISQTVEAVETRVWGLEKRHTRML
jgi:hypothetical protein